MLSSEDYNSFTQYPENIDRMVHLLLALREWMQPLIRLFPKMGGEEEVFFKAFTPALNTHI